MHPERLREILRAPAFQCHKTVDYSEHSEGRPGDAPQQCAGLMGLLLNIGEPNQIMQVGQRLGYFHPDEIRLSECLTDLPTLFAEHERGNNDGG